MKKIFKRTLAVLLAAVMLFGTAPLNGFVGLELPDWLDFSKLFEVEAEADTSGYYTYGYYTYYYHASVDGVKITDVDTSISGAVIIPSTLGGYTVTVIGRGAFRGCDSLTSITIPDSVTIISDSAFSDCDSLTSITVDYANTGFSSDEYGVLFNKDKTVLIKYPEGNTRTSYTIPGSVTSIGERAFYHCDSLTSITIPDGVTCIGDSLFSNCNSLTSITIPGSVTSIGDYAFYHCDSLTSITIPDSVTSIGDSAFIDCNSLTSITIPGSVTSIGERAFNNCNSLTSITVDYANTGFSSDEYGVLFNKDKTVLIKYPEGNTRTSYTIPGSVTSIGDYAFYHCDSLTSITIPDGVTSIGYYAIHGCNRLTDIYYSGTEEEWNAISIATEINFAIIVTVHFNSGMPSTPGVVTGIDIPQTKIQMTDTAMLMEATVYPETADNKEIVWTSSNPNVADFYGDNGVLVAYSNGYTVVTATAVDGGYSDSCIVFVGESSMTLRSNDSFDVPIGQTNDFNVTLVDLESISLTETGEVSIDKLSDKSLSGITAVVANADVAIIDSLEVSDGALKMKVKGVTVGTTYVTLTNTETGEVIYFPIDVFDGEAVYTYDTIPQTVIEDRGVSNFRKNGMNIYDFECEENADGSSNVSFNVYNVSWNIGVVEVFDENGTRINTYSVSAFDNNDLTSIKDNVERFGVLVTNIFKAKNFDDVFDITTSVGSAHTPINTVVPKNGYIRITNDISASDACLIYNMVDISVKVISAIESIDLGNKSKQVTDTVAKTITEEISDSFEGSTSSFFKKLILEINKASSFNDYERFIEYFASFLNSEDIDFNEIFMEVISDVLYDVAEDLVLKSLGAYGEIVSSFYSFNSKVKIMHMLEACQDFEGRGSAYIYDNQTGDQRVSNGIVFSGNIGSETVFRTYSVTYGGLYDNLTDENGEENTRVYEISMVKNGECVQPESKVQVRIPIPDNWVGDKITVYRVTDNNECINMNAHRDGDYMVFETDHFSYYALVNEFELIASIRPPSTTTISYGDSIILHADMNEALPDGWRIEWSADNGNFGYSISADGSTCTITPSKSGDTTFTVTVYDADGNEISKDTQKMTSKAGFFDKIIAFFKKIFGLTKIIIQAK